jgi:hypothetical protein
MYAYLRSCLVKNQQHLFRPFMTTLVELKLNREPMPFSVDEKNDVVLV